MDFTKISVVGLGYIGLPTAAMFASRGVEVVGVDINQDVVATINSGIGFDADSISDKSFFVIPYKENDVQTKLTSL